MIFYYTTSLINKKTYYKLYDKSKNDSSVNFRIKMKKKFIIPKKFFQMKIFSKNLLILNVDWNIMNLADLCSTLISFISDNKRLIKASAVVFEKNTINSNFKNRFVSPKSCVFFCQKSTHDVTLGVIECSAIGISKKIFANCSTFELLATNSLLEIRFIPNFKKYALKKSNHKKLHTTCHFPMTMVYKNCYVSAPRKYKTKGLNFSSILYHRNFVYFLQHLKKINNQVYNCILKKQNKNLNLTGNFCFLKRKYNSNFIFKNPNK